VKTGEGIKGDRQGTEYVHAGEHEVKYLDQSYIGAQQHGQKLETWEDGKAIVGFGCRVA
jgi:hypothetical protein